MGVTINGMVYSGKSYWTIYAQYNNIEQQYVRLMWNVSFNNVSYPMVSYPLLIRSKTCHPHIAI